MSEILLFTTGNSFILMQSDVLLVFRSEFPQKIEYNNVSYIRFVHPHRNKNISAYCTENIL